jgi:predicted nuclease with TOPRIM domain
MLKPIFNLLQRWIASSERDRLDDKFLRLDEKVDHLDTRIDSLERSQSAQSEKLSAIHSVTLANNEALEQKLNRNSVTTEGVRQIVDARLETFQLSLKQIQSLIEQVIKRDYTP